MLYIYIYIYIYISAWGGMFIFLLRSIDQNALSKIQRDQEVSLDSGDGGVI